jgi:hypothetical protein
MFLFVRVMPMIAIFEVKTLVPNTSPKATAVGDGGSH